MKSENDLVITGTVVTDVQLNPGQTITRFRLVHNFGGGRKPLFLDCVLIHRSGLPVPRKGDRILTHSYLRMRAGRIQAVVKTLLIE